MDRPPAALPPPLVERVLGRFGFAAAPAAGLDGLRAVYRAWCARVPFDNVRKMVALATPETPALPGGHAADFFDHWLTHGAGGTCWPSSNALCELLQSLGFAARRVAGSMRDVGVANHASVKVRIDAGDWVVDSSMLSNIPVPAHDAIFIADDPVFAIEIEPAGGTHVLWCDFPPNPTYLPCRLLADPVDHDFYLAAYEATRGRSPFNQRLYARRNHPGEMRVLVGNTLHVKTAPRLTSRNLTRLEVVAFLHEDVGLSEEIVARWIQCGGLEASFAPATGPKPPPVSGTPPSQRVG